MGFTFGIGKVRLLHEAVTTTDATVTALITIPLKEDTIYNAIINLVFDDGTDCGAYGGLATFLHDGTDAVLKDDSISVIFDDITIGGVAAAVSGTDLLINVTGVAATEINWSISVDMIEHTMVIPPI